MEKSNVEIIDSLQEPATNNSDILTNPYEIPNKTTFFETLEPLTPEEQAKQKAEEFIGKNNIKEITNMGYSENATIPVYDFSVKNNNLSFSFSRVSIALILSNNGINGLIPKAFLVSVSIILL